MVIFQYIIKRNSRIYSRHNTKLVIANSLETLMYPRFTSKFPRSDRLSSLTKQTRILLIGNFAFSNTNFRNYGYSWGLKLRSHFRYYFIFPYFHLGPSTSSFLFNSLQPFLSFLLPLRLCSFFLTIPFSFVPPRCICNAYRWRGLALPMEDYPWGIIKIFLSRCYQTKFPS